MVKEANDVWRNLGRKDWEIFVRGSYKRSIAKIFTKYIRGKKDL